MNLHFKHSNNLCSSEIWQISISALAESPNDSFIPDISVLVYLLPLILSQKPQQTSQNSAGAHHQGVSLAWIKTHVSGRAGQRVHQTVAVINGTQDRSYAATHLLDLEMWGSFSPCLGVSVIS